MVFFMLSGITPCVPLIFDMSVRSSVSFDQCFDSCSVYYVDLVHGVGSYVVCQVDRALQLP